MKMSTALLNGTEVENHGRKCSLKDMVGSHFEVTTKMKNISTPGADFDKLLSSKVGEVDGSNNAEMASMKELFEIHLDYMQQQSEQLAKKDKIIEDLKNENEMLKQRLARMERRVSLGRAAVRSAEKKPVSPEQAGAAGPGATAAAGGAAESIGRKRRLTGDSGGRETPAGAGAGGGKRSASSGPGGGMSAASVPGGPPSTGSSQETKRHRQERQSTHPAIRIKQEPDENENEPAINLDDCLTSRIAYHTLVGDKPNCLLKYVKRSKKQKPDHSQLEIPLWRVKHLTSTYTMEGTENLSDDVFERRHYKLMVDEKKRKRWDVQRIREQRQRERLRSREEAEKRLASQEQIRYRSLWPQHAEGLRLCVTPLVPVSAFGINLPTSVIQDFSLPWKEGTRIVTYRRRTKR